MKNLIGDDRLKGIFHQALEALPPDHRRRAEALVTFASDKPNPGRWSFHDFARDNARLGQTGGGERVLELNGQRLALQSDATVRAAIDHELALLAPLPAGERESPFDQRLLANYKERE